MDKTAAFRPRHTRRSPRLVFALLCAALPVLMLLSVLWGRYPVTLMEFWVWFRTLAAPADATVYHVIADIRLPRIAAAVVVGMALSAAGSAYQGVFRNPMVSPDILGASAGAGFGASLAILWGWPAFWVQQLSFGFGLAAVAATGTLSSFASSRGSKTLVLILSGMVVAAMFNAMISIAK